MTKIIWRELTRSNFRQQRSSYYKKLLEKAISDFKKVNQLQGINFTRRFQAIIDRYNERREDDVLNGEEFDTFSQEMTDIIYDIKTEMGTGPI